MFISLHWLKQYVRLPKNVQPREIANDLTMHTVEVDELTIQGELAKRCLVAVVENLEAHPNADKLKIATVNDGSKTRKRVVCGGANIAPGMLVAFAPVGTPVRWHGEGEPKTLERASIRGEESEGMICAGVEIDLGHLDEGEHNILDLSQLGVSKRSIGSSVYDVLEKKGFCDCIIEVDNKSMNHRPDLWGHYGIARELAAIYGTTLTPLSALAPSIKSARTNTLNAEISPDSKARALTLMALSNVVVRESPQALKNMLRAVGINPINNIVDITNFVMFELGQPTHAYDRDKLKSETLVARNAKEGERFTTLDGTTRSLSSTDVVIAEQRGRAVALAGVMGGRETEISSATTSIVIESGCFDPVKTRRTAKRLGIPTEASLRFEKSPDATKQPELAARRIVTLLKEYCPGVKIASSLAHAYAKNIKEYRPRTITVSASWLQVRIGKEISKREIVEILKRLEFAVSANGDTLTVNAPAHRPPKDISIPEDIVEEVARIHGYDNIAPVLPNVPMLPPDIEASYAKKRKERDREWRMRDILAMRGFTEVVNYSFIGKRDLRHCSVELSGAYLKLMNSLSEHQSHLRRDLTTGLLGTLGKNERDVDELAIFEVGRVYLKEEQGAMKNDNEHDRLPGEQLHVAIFVASKTGKGERTIAPLETVQRESEALLRHLHLDAHIEQRHERNTRQLSWMAPGIEALVHPTKSARIVVNGADVGCLAEVHPGCLNDFPNVRAAFMELNCSALNALDNAGEHETMFRALAKYPSVRFDLALVVPCDVRWSELERTLRGAGPLVHAVQPFDVYEGKGLEPETKSVAFHVVLRSDDHTLEEREIEQVRTALLKRAGDRHGAALRTSR